MSRVYNFSAGPAMLPEIVLKQAQTEIIDFNNTGMSVMEMSHRGKNYMAIATQAESDLRTLMKIPDNYKVLFLQGGASSQFTMIPMNLLNGKLKAAYFNTGQWSQKAIAEAKRFCDVHIVSDSTNNNFSTIADCSQWDIPNDVAYVHYTPNETIGGLEFDRVPDTGDIPLVADMSSTILSRPVDVSKFGVIYAGAQKNIGPAGLTIVIIREDLMGNIIDGAPALFDYKTLSDGKSMVNTPPTYAWYLAGLVFKWGLDQGGLIKLAEVNKRKAKKLYDAIDNIDFYENPIEPKYRSWMNVPFTLKNAKLDDKFLKQAADNGLITLKGHRLVGGMRASIYNAMPESGVDALIAFMEVFAKANT